MASPSVAVDLAAALLVNLGVIAGILLLGLWVAWDARDRGSEWPGAWGVGCVLLAPLLVVYLLARWRIGPRTEPADTRERVVGTVVLGHFLAILPGGLVAPPDPITQAIAYLVLIGPALLVAYGLVWHHGWARLRRGVRSRST